MNQITVGSTINVNSKVEAVQELYALGFNVLPLEFGSKKPAGNWKMLQTTRLPAGCLEWQFEGRNIGVLVGRTSMNLFVVDCDTDEAFNYWSSILHAKGLDKWIVSSVHGGHFWFLSEEGEVKSIPSFATEKRLKKPEEKYQIWGRGHYMVVPPSVRMDGPFSGFVYSWLNREGELPPVLSAQTIGEIFHSLRVVKSLLAGRLPQLAYQAIIEQSHYGYASHSEAEFAAICSLLRIGWCEDEIVRLFDEHQPVHYMKANSDSDWLISHMISPARAVVKSNKGDVIQNLLIWSRDRLWKGRTGQTDRAVFEACCKRAMQESPFRFRATVREISELCNQTNKTTNKSLRRLVQDGCLKLLTVQNFKRVQEANYFGFPRELQDYHSSETTRCTIPVVLPSDFREHDVWHQYGLGKKALFLYEYLLGSRRFNGETADEITSALKAHMDIKMRAVKTVLPRLALEGLVEESNGRWGARRVKLDRLDEIAQKLGVLGKSNERQAAHNADRAVYALRILIQTQKPPLETLPAPDVQIPFDELKSIMMDA